MKNRVQFLRRQRRWSRQELAARVGVSFRCIHAIEQERFLPSVKLAYNIAAVFGQSVMDVFPPQMVLPVATARDADLQSVAIPMERSVFAPRGLK